MNLLDRLCNNICNHSTSYMVLISSYSVSLYELWNQNNKTKENLTTTFLLLIPIFFGVLEIADIQILNLFRNKVRMNQKKILSKLGEITVLMNNSLDEEDEKENRKYIMAFLNKIDEIKIAFVGFEKKLARMNQIEMRGKNRKGNGKRKGKGKRKKK